MIALNYIYRPAVEIIGHTYGNTCVRTLFHKNSYEPRLDFPSSPIFPNERAVLEGSPRHRIHLDHRAS